MKREFFVVCFLFSLGLVLATTSEASFCCEKTIEGAWCVNEEESMCSSAYRSTPTSCSSTSYCRLGTCYDSEEGICMENVAQVTCEEGGGTWTDADASEVAQCSLGCCIVSDQAAFVSLIRCKRLSSLYGIDADWDNSITSETECLDKANSQDVGACVYSEGYETVCEFTTRGDCNAERNIEVINSTESSSLDSIEKTFYQDYLCSAEELATTCARQVGTVCYNGDVYWVDSCGNRENVWSSDEDKSWNNGRVMEASDVCEPNDGEDDNCGNCDYLLGTRCAESDRFGSDDHYCRTNECVDEDGNVRMNGEAWCVADENEDSPGARYYRQVCDDGEVETEPCAEYRNEVCVESYVETTAGDFGTASCSVNRWEDCILQTDEDVCLDADERDCKWVDYVYGLSIGNTTNGENGGVCLPVHAPGLEFWDEGSADEVCGQASVTCTVVTESDIFGEEEIVEGAECLEKAWAESLNSICVSLGDCGASVNYDGEYSEDGYSWIDGGEEREL